jgi:hypothetical protein
VYWPNGQYTVEHSDGVGGWTLLASPNLSPGRMRHTATVTPDGWIVVTGGCFDGTSCNNVSLFPPNSLSARPATPLRESRRGHQAVLFGDRLYVFGGRDIAGNPLASVEYASMNFIDGGLSAWANVPPMREGRAYFAAAPLPGDKLLIAGGDLNDGGALQTAEVYDLRNPGATPLPDMAQPRHRLTATWIPDAGAAGRVLVFGGNTFPARPELWDVALGKWCPAWRDGGP